jgi:AcrR family transcriptional regulator
MGRWQPDARGRLEKAALELFIDDGYNRTTVAGIAARAGVTERTFFRYFADKPEVLFGGGHELEDLLVKRVATVPASVAPLEAIASAFEFAAAEIFAERRSFARQRQTIINANPDLQERELLKLASLTAALAAALRDRGASEPGASLAAESGMAVFKTAFAQWVSQDGTPDLGEIIRQTLAEIKAVVTGA